MGICCLAQETQTGTLDQPRGVGWGGRKERGSKGKEYMYTMEYYSAIKRNTFESVSNEVDEPRAYYSE